MKNTTIPITATIVFSAAVAVLNVVQNEPSRLHANGSKILGAVCWTKEDDTENKSKCMAAGWYGALNAARNGPGNLADYPLGSKAFECVKKEFNEKKKQVLKGAAFAQLMPNSNCPMNNYYQIEEEKGKKVWKWYHPKSHKATSSDLCGKYDKVELTGNCDLTEK
jgi:hypothetical protein